MNFLHWIFLIANLITVGFSQKNAGSSVAPNLIKCYNNTLFLENDNRLPATIETLIALIRKIEDSTTYSNNRELGAKILQSFRQDGITKSVRGVVPSKYGIPYSPKEWNSYRNIVLLKNIIPNQSELDMNVLTDLEQCSLHYLLSKSMNYVTRGDEQYVCNQLGKYRMRQKRSKSPKPDQVEMFGNDVDIVSSCPVELGVVNTNWGAVSAGSLLAGIVSGFNYQQIPINSNSQLLDSRYGATIAGDLAEAALYQIGRTNGQTVEIGADGNWNCTLEPKWYFVKKNNLLQFTDSEIRGDLDGLYLALSMNDIKNKFPDIKISQILDLYYSPRGVLSDSLKACNRKSQETTFTTTEKLIEQTSYFEALLDPVATLDSSIDPQRYKELAQLAVGKFHEYLPGNLNDPGCSDENSIISRVSSDLVIFLDSGYDYKKIQPMISFLLDNIDVNRFETTYSLINAKKGTVLINSSATILDFHQNFNESVHKSLETGMDFALTIDTIETLMMQKLNNNTNLGGFSYIYLIVTQTSPNDNQKDYASTKIDEMRRKYPDMRILVIGVGQKTDYKDYVINTDSDVFILPDTSNTNSIGSEAAYKTKMREVVQRMKEIPRSVINSNCGSNFDNNDKTTITLEQYVEPTGTNIYKVSPNYFYNHADDAVLRIKGKGYGSLKVCTGRMSNQSRNIADNCKTINSDDFSEKIDSYCDGSMSDCEPVYIYITGDTSYIRCTDYRCRFPDSIKFTISLENVACASGASKFMSSSSTILCITLLFFFTTSISL